MLRRIYDATIALSTHRRAVPALGVVSFIESSVFPIPPDAMMVPMILARPDRAWIIAGVATIASVLGGIAGFEIPMTRVETKLKLSQNRARADRDGVLAAIDGENAEFMRRYGLPEKQG